MAHDKPPRFRRRLSTIASAVSLLLCLATLALWLRSYFRYDELSGDGFLMLSLKGHLLFVYAPGQFPRTKWNSYGLGLAIVLGTNSWYPSWDKRFLFDRPSRGAFALGCTHWFLVLPFAILPATRLVSMIRTERRQRLGLCPTCGYDLRASPERCPECGTEISDQKSEIQRRSEL